MPIGKLDHFSIRTVDIESSRQFYTDIMGFQVGFRPEFKFPGLWLYNGPQYPETTGVVHIVGVDLNDLQGLKDYLGDKDLDTLSGTGTVDHMAFAATGVNEMRDRLKKHGLTFRERTVPALNLHQIFFEDPSGVTIELNYPGSEVQQAA